MMVGWVCVSVSPAGNGAGVGIFELHAFECWGWEVVPFVDESDYPFRKAGFGFDIVYVV
jgi:hypothetical protein